MNYLEFLEKISKDTNSIRKQLPSGSYILNIAEAEIEEYKHHINDDLVENPHLFFQYTVFKTKTELPFSVSIVPRGVSFTLNDSYSFYLPAPKTTTPDYQKIYEWTLLTIRLLLRGQLYVAVTNRKGAVVALEIIFKKSQTYKILLTEIDFPFFGDSDEIFIARNKVRLQKAEEDLPNDFFLYDCTDRVPYRGRKITSLEPERMSKTLAKKVSLKIQYENAFNVEEQDNVISEIFSRALTWVLFFAAVVFVFLLPDGWSTPAGIALSLVLFYGVLPVVLKPKKNRADTALEKVMTILKSKKSDWTSALAIIITASFFVVDMTLLSGEEVSMFSLRGYTSFVYLPLITFIMLSITTLITNKLAVPFLKFLLVLSGLITYALAQELPDNFEISSETYPDTLLSFINNNVIAYAFIILPIVYAYRLWSANKIQSETSLNND